MTWFNRSLRNRQEAEATYAQSASPDAVAELRAAVVGYERARAFRDKAITVAASQHTQRVAAEVSGLSLSRVKQIVAGREVEATRLPITDVDLFGFDAPDRVLSIFEVDPFIERFTSEREFLKLDPRRQTGDRYDLSLRLYDVDPSERWVAVYIESTKELYAFAAQTTAQIWGTDDVAPGDQDAPQGSLAGPVILLGHVPTYAIVDAGINLAVSVAADRPGGLGWLLGRIRLLNRVANAVFDPSDKITREEFWDYLSTLPKDERPNR